jgi:hypothetical protein
MTFVVQGLIHKKSDTGVAASGGST